MTAPSETIRAAAEDAKEALGKGRDALEEHLGLKRWSLRGLLEKKRPQVPSVDRAKEICEALGLEFYIGPARPHARPEKSRAITQDFRSVRDCLLQLTAALDDLDPRPDANVVGDADEDGLYGVGSGWLQAWGARRVATIDTCGMTEVTDDVMEPTLSKGSAVLVDRSRNNPSDKGVFMLRADGHQRVFRRLRRESNRRWVAYGDNPLSEDGTPTLGRGMVVGKVLWAANDLREDIGPFAREPRLVYMAFARQVKRPALIKAARGIPLQDLEAFALDAALVAEKRYADILEVAEAAGLR